MSDRSKLQAVGAKLRALWQARPRALTAERLLLLGSTALFFLPLTARALWDSDEGRYAEIAREMLELKDWISPHLNYVLYFEKPPLMYWLTAASMALFGQNTFAVRFWCPVFGVLTVALTYSLGKHWKNERTGLLAGGILATSLGFFALTQFVTLDMALTFWMTLELFAATRLLTHRDAGRIRRYAFLFAIATAGGLMTKGPVAIVLPAAAIVIAIAYSRSWSVLGKIPWAPAAVLCAVLAAPWYILVSIKHPFFLEFFFIHEHIARFLTKEHHRMQPIYFFIPVLLGGMLPWTFFLPRIAGRWFGRRAPAAQRDPAAALLLSWSIFIFVFFSLSHSKLIGYILPIYPALAALLAYEFDEALSEPSFPSWVTWGVGGLIAFFIAGLAIVKWPSPLPFMAYPDVEALVMKQGAFPFLVGLSVFIWVGVWGMRRVKAVLAGLFATQAVLLLQLIAVSTAMDPFLSSKALAEIVRDRAQPQDKIVDYGIPYENRLQTFVYYAQRRIAVYGSPGELAMGAERDPGAAGWFVPEASAYAALLALPSGSWGITDSQHWRELQSGPNADTFDYLKKEGDLYLFQKIR